MDTSSPAAPSSSARLALADLLTCMRFYTRLPIPVWSFETVAFDQGAFGRSLRFAPVAGFVVGTIASLVLLVAGGGLGLPVAMAATLALAAQILVSGGLHEDGLADMADGFGGGRSRERKLEIMRDSRIGAFGALALLLSAALRILAVSGLVERYGLMTAVAALPAAGAMSRAFGLLPLGLLRSARTQGLGHAAGVIGPVPLGSTVAVAVFLGMTLPYVGGMTEARALGACAATLMASLGVMRLAHRHIGGHTGDVAGAAQQAGEIAYLMALLVAPWHG